MERDAHSISRRNISRNALKVLSILARAGFHAFLVGGGVRDLLLGGHPKDFDVATDATPEEVRRLFRNSRIIGRRFKIVHIRFGREIIEVTTFRAHHEVSTRLAADQPRRGIAGLDSAHASSGMILRDNVYGPIDEDAMRRDFTVNALYYTTADRFRLYDFCGGLADLAARQLRIIGDPEARYTEDPVRMLRAIRFAAKLDFQIEAATEAPINPLSHLLEDISSARLFDESLKLLTAGHARRTWEMLSDYEAAKYLFGPTLRATLDPDLSASRVVSLALRNTDSRIAEDKPVSPAFLFAALLWPVLQRQLVTDFGVMFDGFAKRGPVTQLQLDESAGKVLEEQVAHTAIPRRFTTGARDIWRDQLRLMRMSPEHGRRMVQQPKFRAAYDFMLLRNEAGEALQEPCQWWTEFQQRHPPPEPRPRQRYERRQQPRPEKRPRLEGQRRQHKRKETVRA